MQLLKELFEIREREIIKTGDVDSVVGDFKFAIDHIKAGLDVNMDFEELVKVLQKDLKLSQKEAALIANLLKK